MTKPKPKPETDPDWDDDADRLVPLLDGRCRLWLDGTEHLLARPKVGTQRLLDEAWVKPQIIDRENAEWASDILAGAGINIDELGDKDEVVRPSLLLKAARNQDPEEALKRTQARHDAVLDWWTIAFERLADPPVTLDREDWPVFLLNPATVVVALGAWAMNPPDPGGR